MARPPRLTDRLAGAVWGHLVGDALGVPYEFRDAADITSVEWGVSGSHHQPPGTWSDDGSLMLALLDSLLEVGFDPEDQGRRAVAWFRKGAYAPGGKTFDWGRTTQAAIEAIERGVPALDAGPSGEDDCGNGSLMRIVPLALVERDGSDERLIELAHRASRVTHGHPRCQVACAWYSLIVRRLLAGTLDRAEALADARAVLRATYEGQDLAAHLVALDELDAWTGRSGRGFVLDSFWSAWDAFAAADSYADAVIRAVRYGRDTDTTAAIAGGLAGAWFGIDAIPADWRAGVRDPDIVQPLVDRLVDERRIPPPSLPVLAAFAADFAEPRSFGEWRGGERTPTGAIQMPWVEYGEWADRFRRACAEGNWVRPDIDWPAWAQTTEAQRLRDDPEAMASATVHDLACMLTWIIRSDRFSEGSFLGAYESGVLERIVHRAAELDRGRAG